MMNILVELIDIDEICLSKNININPELSYGLIQEVILKSLNTYIYTVEHVKIMFTNGTKKVLGEDGSLFTNLIDESDKPNIKKFIVLKRFRDNKGNVLSNNLIDKYNSYIQCIEDAKLAHEMQHDYTYQRYNGMNPRTSHREQYNQMSNIIGLLRRTSNQVEQSENSSTEPGESVEPNVSTEPGESVEPNVSTEPGESVEPNVSTETSGSTEPIESVEPDVNSTAIPNQVNNFYNNFNFNSATSGNPDNTGTALYDLVFSTMMSDIRDNNINEINLDIEYQNNDVLQPPPPLPPVVLPISAPTTPSGTAISPPISNTISGNIPITSLTANNILSVIENMITQGVNNTQNLQDVKIVCTDDEFSKLTVMTYAQLKQSSEIELIESCPITLVDFTNDSKIIVLPCNHCIGLSGGTKWLKEQSNKCPICREKCSTGQPI